MKINLTLEIEGTEFQQDQIQDTLELAAEEGKSIVIHTATGSFVAGVVDVAEAP